MPRPEVERVESGHRITLTLNLLLDASPRQPPSAGTAVEDAAARLREHFTTPVTRYVLGPAAPPKRLV